MSTRRPTFVVSHPAQTEFRVLGPASPADRAAAQAAWDKVQADREARKAGRKPKV